MISISIENPRSTREDFHKALSYLKAKLAERKWMDTLARAYFNGLEAWPPSTDLDENQIEVWRRANYVWGWCNVNTDASLAAERLASIAVEILVREEAAVVCRDQD